MQHLGLIDSALAFPGRSKVTLDGGWTSADLPSTYALVEAAAGHRDQAHRWLSATLRSGGKGSSRFHHAEYNLAAAYALLGEQDPALVWLRRTGEDGMPNYPLFASDPNLKSPRGTAAFEAFLGEQRLRHGRYRAALER